MRRINIYAFFAFGSQLSIIKSNHATAWDLMLCKVVLVELLKDPLLRTMPSSLSHGDSLVRTLSGVLQDFDPFGSDGVGDETRDRVRKAYTSFETFLAEELIRANVYAVDPKGIFETDALVNRASEAIPPKLLNALPAECANDLQQAGRCLAFELPTAAGFHIMRAVDASIWKYWDKVMNKERPNNRNWGSAIKDLAGGGGDAKITAALTQLKDLHRNPVVHPEVTLEIDEALALWQVAPGAIIAIARELLK